MHSKVKLAALILISGIVFLAGCSQSPPVYIVGVWTETSYRYVVTTNAAVTLDTTLRMTGSDTFNANHLFGYSGDSILAGSEGTFTIDGQTVKLYNSNGALTLTETVTTLVQHSLVLQYIDTTSYTPFTTITHIRSFIR